MRVTHKIVMGLVVVAAATLGQFGCASGDKPAEANSGKSFSTSPGQQLTEDMFLGKWDVDGERTNTANGYSGVGAVPADIAGDLFGKGWRLEHNNVAKIDLPVGWKTGSWRLSGTNTLIVNTGKGDEAYSASFLQGYMYLTKPDGKKIVFERDKYFGL